MTVQRIRIALRDTEYAALADLARAELRPLEHQARYLLRSELERRGLLKDAAEPDEEHSGEVATCQG